MDFFLAALVAGRERSPKTARVKQGGRCAVSSGHLLTAFFFSRGFWVSGLEPQDRVRFARSAVTGLFSVGTFGQLRSDDFQESSLDLSVNVRCFLLY